MCQYSYLAAWSKDGVSLVHLYESFLSLSIGAVHEGWMYNHPLKVL